MISIVTGLLVLVFLLLFMVWYGYILVGEILAGPYIPTHRKEIMILLAKLNLKKGKVFLELGSGDGRVVRAATKEYGVKGVGIEFHPLVCMWARFLSRKEDIKFICGSFWEVEIPDADYYYCYLTPKGTNQVGERIFNKLGKGKVIISKAFEVWVLKKYLIKTLNVAGNKYFYYQL